MPGKLSREQFVGRIRTATHCLDDLVEQGGLRLEGLACGRADGAAPRSAGRSDGDVTFEFTPIAPTPRCSVTCMAEALALPAACSATSFCTSPATSAVIVTPACMHAAPPTHHHTTADRCRTPGTSLTPSLALPSLLPAVIQPGDGPARMHPHILALHSGCIHPSCPHYYHAEGLSCQVHLQGPIRHTS